LGFSNKDRTFWVGIIFLVVIVSFGIAFMFFPLIETNICTEDGACADTKILKSYWEILTGQ